MSEPRFTEGEWKHVVGIGYCCIRTGEMDDRTGRVIADMRLAGGYYNVFDACLMSASKDLYEALELTVKEIERTFVERDFVSLASLAKARKALDKARGE